jgi:uncharacterized protein
VKLRVSDDLSLPADAVTSTIVVYGGKGMGKTNLASVLVEEFAAAHQRFAVIDPMGVWWGLRHSASGKGAGIKVLILGGLHGGMPIEPTSGAVVADLVADEDVSVIIDISRRADGSMWTIGERVRFVTDYVKRLYQRQGEKRRPIAQVIDEAARFAPQVVRAGDLDVAKCMSAVAVLVEEGRNVGVGVTLVTQRSARLNKDVAELADCMIAFRTVGPNSMRAVLDWLGEHVEKARHKDIAEKLRGLPRGTALVVSPGWLEFEGIVAMRKRKTFDSSKTPESGDEVRASGPGATIDLAKYQARMAEVVEQAKANDPTELKKQVAALKKELAKAGRGDANEKGSAESIQLRARVADLERDLAAARKIKEKIVVKQVEVVKAADLRRLEDLVKKIDKLIVRITGTHADLELHLSGLRAEAVKLKEIATRVTEFKVKKKGDAGKLIDDVIALTSETPPSTALPARPPVNAPARTPRKIAEKRPSSASNGVHVVNGAAVSPPGGLKPVHLRLLSAIAWWESIGVSAPDLGGVAFVAKTSTKSSAFDNNRSKLRASGYIEYPSSGHVRLTDAGRAVAPPPDLPPTNAALQDAILGMVTPAHGRMLRALIDAYPEEMSLEEFAKRSGSSVTSSAFDNNRSWLRARGLAEYPRTGFVRATQLLFPEAS